MSNRESATRFASRVSGASAAIGASRGVRGRTASDNAARRRSGALRGMFEHESYDTAARRYASPLSLRQRRYANAVVRASYVAAGVVLYLLYELLLPLR